MEEFPVKKRVQKKLKLVPHKRVKSLEESGHTPVCRYCWMIVRPNVVRHAKSWTKDYEKCIAEGNANCTGVDEEVRIAYNCYQEDDKPVLQRSKSV